MKLKTLILVLVILTSSYSVMAIMSNPWSNDLINQDKNSVKQGKEVGILGVPNKLSGDIFSGNYIRVGINNLGTLGVTNGSNTGDPGVGFQASIDTPFKWPSTESVAVGWWGEGYVISYVVSGIRKVAYWQPGFGYPCSACNITPISNNVITNIDDFALKETKVKTKDGNLTMTFRFRFLKDLPVLSLETTINNTGTVQVAGIRYKRIIDWDVCANNGNNWESTGTEAYAWGYCNPLRASIQLTISGHDGIGELPEDDRMPVVNYVDLYAWDDQNIRGPANPVQSSTPIVGDYNAGIYYDIGPLRPGQSKTVYTIYQMSRYGQN